MRDTANFEFAKTLASSYSGIEEAALTLGKPPARVFSKVVLPNFRTGIISAIVTMFIYFPGIFVMLTMLGRPQGWNMTVIITDKTVGDANVALGAALSFIMLLFTVLSIAVLMFATRRAAK